MSLENRVSLYGEYEQEEGRPVIAYVTSIREAFGGQMAGDAIPSIIRAVDSVPKDVKEIDFLIISNGGDPITALRIITILRERFDSIRVVIPYVAYSAATVLALGADAIIMHPYSNLGPVDPQLTVTRPDINGSQSQISFSSEDIRNYIAFIREDVGVTDQEYLTKAFETLAGEVGSLPIGSSKRSQQLSSSLSLKMLKTHMEDQNQALAISQALNSSYFHHGYAVGRKEAKEIGLEVIEPGEETERIIWDIWCDFCSEMKCDEQFSPIEVLMGDPETKEKINNVPVVNIPAGFPPEIATQIAIQAVPPSCSTTKAIEVTTPIAAIESSRIAMVNQTTMSILGWRNINMALDINISSFSKGWESRRH